MHKLDGTENNVYEVDTSFTIMKKQRPVSTDKEEVRPLLKTYY